MSELMIPDSALPAHLQGQTSDASDLVTSTGSVPRISLRGRRFRLINGEEERAAPEGSPLTVVILAATPHGKHCAKVYYAKGYVPGSDDPPDCSSEDGVTPSSMVDDPVSDNCAACPMNAWGSAKTLQGKDAKACKDQKHLWVVNPQNMDGTVYRLAVPPVSLKALSDFGRALAARNVPMSAIVTKIQFVDSEFPQIEFAYDGFLTQAQFDDVRERVQTAEFAQLTATAAPRTATALEAPSVPEVSKAPASAAAPKMTALATNTYDEYTDAGWTDELLIEHGLMEV